MANTMCCQPYNSVFTELHEQGAAPWINGSLMEFSYNLFGDTFHGSSYGFQQYGQDPENSNVPSYGMRLVHNISVDIPWCNGCSTNKVFVGLNGAPNANFSHNTILSGGSSTPVPYELYSGTDVCTYVGGGLLGSYLQSPGATISSNILGYGMGLGVPRGVCDSIPTGINNNLFLNDLSWAPDSWVAAQGNQMVAAKPAIGFVGTCTADSYLNCALASSSPYKGSAPDGSDPGADVYAVQDRIHRWSEQAGLLLWEGPRATMIENPGAFDYAARHVAMRFHRFGPLAGCSVQLFTNRARTLLHPDTATTGNQACARAGNIDENGIVTFVFGAVAPLAAGTTYAYQIVDGIRVMVGEFTTASSEPTGPVTIQISDQTATDALIEASATADFSSAVQSAPVSFSGGLATLSTNVSGVRYYRWLKRANGKVIAYGPAGVAFRE